MINPLNGPFQTRSLKTPLKDYRNTSLINSSEKIRLKSKNIKRFHYKNAFSSLRMSERTT